MTATVTDRQLLDAIEPYVLMAASTLISCAYQHLAMSRSVLNA